LDSQIHLFLRLGRPSGGIANFYNRRSQDKPYMPEVSRPSARGAAPRPERPIPAIAYPEDLPVSARRDEIARAIAGHQVVIVSGETGSGKTTQLPKICLELGRGRQRMIGHTQPRRLAATSVARRIAEELN